MDVLCLLVAMLYDCSVNEVKDVESSSASYKYVLGEMVNPAWLEQLIYNYDPVPQIVPTVLNIIRVTNRAVKDVVYVVPKTLASILKVYIFNV